MEKPNSSTSCSDKSPVKVCGLEWLDGGLGGKIVFKLVNNEGSEPSSPTANPKLS